MVTSVLGPFATGHLLVALCVLFGGTVSVGMFAFLLANVYFLPGPPSVWAFRAGIAGAVLGAALAGVGLPLFATAVLVAESVPVVQSLVLAGVGVALYLAGLVWLEISSRPTAAW